jgi:DNA-binding transcriptional LysR family regulator
MQLAALKVFCDLVHFRSFSKTAEANDVSQPTVTRMVHQLEAHLGGQLIDRSKRPLQLTALGQAYYEGCKSLLDQYTELELSLRRAHAEMELTVRVAAIYSVGLWDMSQYVDRFKVDFAHARVHIDYLHPALVYERVLDGSADLGLVSFPARSRELTVLPWREEEMVLACSPMHPLARCQKVRPQQLDGVLYIAFDNGLEIRRQVDRFLREHGVTVEVVHEFDNIETLKKAVEIGAGVALLPEPMLAQELQAGTLRAVPLDGASMIRPIGIIHRRQHRLSTAVLGFIDLLRNGAAHHSANGNGRHANSSTSKRANGGSRRGRGKGMKT